MRSSVRRLVTLAGLLLVLTGCGVNDDDIEHWKHTQRGPGKIATVLMNAQYPEPLRVHAVRALIEMKHPNANGLDLLQGAMQTMPAADHEGIVHALLPELQTMMGTTGAAPGAGQGPTETQIRAKDAAYVLLRGDGHASFANAEDRAALANGLLDWELADLNTRALAGAFTAEQVVAAVGPSAATRLTASISSADAAIPVTVKVAELINNVAVTAGKQEAVTRIIGVANEIAAPAATERLRATAHSILGHAGREPDVATINTAAERLRGQYLLVLYEAIKTLAQPAGTDYLIHEAGNAAEPLDRRKAALTAVAGGVSAAQSAALLDIVRCTPGPTCDADLRGAAIDRLGETHDRNQIPTIYELFAASNGGTADMSFTLRWKLGEAILKLGGRDELPAFLTHLALPRQPPFAGYTFQEINGYAQAVGDLAPPPREAMRTYVTAAYAVPVRLVAIMFLGIKGTAVNLPTLEALATDSAAITGEGWTDAQLGTVGAVARRAHDQLQQSLRQGQPAAPSPAAPSPAAPSPAQP